MVDEFAMVGGIQTFPHLPQEPLIVVHEALYGLPHKGVRIATAIGGKPVKPSLQLGTEIYFHAPRVRAEAAGVKHGAHWLADNYGSSHSDTVADLIENRLQLPVLPPGPPNNRVSVVRGGKDAG
jgi:hypothetical protein